MAAPRYDVIGIGNAIVDVLARTDDDFLVRQKMPKGSMSLIDEARAEAIYSAMGPATEISGGSAANTMVGVASFGGRVSDSGEGRWTLLAAVSAASTWPGRLLKTGPTIRLWPTTPTQVTPPCLSCCPAGAMDCFWIRPHTPPLTCAFTCGEVTAYVWKPMN